MTDNNHPITPPDELVEQWCYEDGDEIRTSPRWYRRVCAKAARWGADQELDACCEWFVRDWTDIETADKLRAARRPKPKSLKEKGLGALGRFTVNAHTNASEMTRDFDIIRRALEQLDD